MSELLAQDFFGPAATDLSDGGPLRVFAASAGAEFSSKGAARKAASAILDNARLLG